jgi:hypothetical protein
MSACVVCLTPQDALRENKIKARVTAVHGIMSTYQKEPGGGRTRCPTQAPPAVNVQYLWQRLDRSRGTVHGYNTTQRHNHAAEMNKRNREQKKDEKKRGGKYDQTVDTHLRQILPAVGSKTQRSEP